MKITKQEMAKQLARVISIQTTAGILAYNVPRAELERLMRVHGLSLTTDLCEGCGNVIKSWYDHDVACKLA